METKQRVTGRWLTWGRWLTCSFAAVSLIFALAETASAQDPGSIQVQVVHAETGEPLAGTQVQVVGTTIGGLTSSQGSVTLQNVPAGDRVVRVTSLGYAAVVQNVNVPAGGQATVNISMVSQAIGMGDIVVTALGIERSERGLGYAVQSIGAEELEASPQVSVSSMLAGRAAGVQVTSSGGSPGSDARIVIRGESSLSTGGQPLWVVDGVPISTDTDSHAGFALVQGNVGGRSMDIDPNNIEDMTILRGAAATALYGSRAAHGAIIVTTRRGQAGQPATFTFNTRIAQDRPILAGNQTMYAAGIDGLYCSGIPAAQGGFCDPALGTRNPGAATAWGPHRDSIPAHIYQMAAERGQEIRFEDPMAQVLSNAWTRENSLGVRGSIGGGNYNLGVTHLDQEATMPGLGLERLNINANLSYNITERLQSQTSVLFSNSRPDRAQEGFVGVMAFLRHRAPNVNLRDVYQEDGVTPRMYSHRGGNEWPHPHWRTENEVRSSEVNRWVASQNFAYTIVPGLRLANRIGLDTYIDERGQFFAERPWRTARGENSGESRLEKITRQQLNNDLMLSLDGVQVAPGITVSGLVGGNVNMRERASVGALGRDILIPGSFTPGNYARQDIVSTGLPTQQRIIGAYSQATIDYQDWLYLNLTARNDWSSTLPTDNNSYFYPSAAVGFIFSDAFGLRNDWLDYGKLRVSYAQVGADAPPYRLRTSYGTAGGGGLDFPFRGVQAFRQSNSLGNPDLRPESTDEFEAGLEFRFLQGRARVEGTYYNKRSYDQIFNVPSSSATGYTSITRNAGDLRNEGWELSLMATPVQAGNFSWDVRANWSQNRSHVMDLADGVVSLHLAGWSWPSVQIRADEAYGVLWGFGWQRDEQGRMLLGENGFPLLTDTQIVMGNMQADWLGNLTNTVRWGPLTVSGILDTKQGGDLFNFDLNYTVAPGMHSNTECRTCTRTFEGVDAATGEPRTATHTTDQDFWQEYARWGKHEPQIEDGTYIRLREVFAAYRLPANLTNRMGVGSLDLTASVHNVAIWTDYSQGDPESSVFGTDNPGGVAYEQFSYPQNRTLSFAVRATF